MNEQWRPIPGYEGQYEVSDRGQVRSIDRLVSSRGRPYLTRGRVLQTQLDKHGYRQLGLKVGGTRRRWFVHQLVLLAFIGPRPDGAITRHLNGTAIRSRESAQRRNARVTS